MFHVNPTSGDVGQCSAKKSCPFGGPETHFTTKEAARSAYEAQMAGTLSRPKTFEEKFPYVLEVTADSVQGKVSGSGKRSDGSYPRLFFKLRPEGVKIYGSRKELLSYLEAQGVTAESAGVSRDDDLLSTNESYVREQTPLVTPGQPRPKVARVTKPKPHPTPTSKETFDAAILELVPEPKDSKIAELPQIDDHQGYLGGTRYAGALANSKKDETGNSVYISQREASAGIKQLISAAKKSGELPAWLDVSVRKNDGTWVTSINVEIGYRPEGERKAVPLPKEWIQEAEDRFKITYTPAAKRLHDYVSLLSRQYESSDVNGMVDHYNSSNAGRTNWRY